MIPVLILYGVPRKRVNRLKKSDKKKLFQTLTTCGLATLATALNEHGKAALVMANSAWMLLVQNMKSEERIEEGIISQMVTSSF